MLNVGDIVRVTNSHYGVVSHVLTSTEGIYYEVEYDILEMPTGQAHYGYFLERELVKQEIEIPDGPDGFEAP